MRKFLATLLALVMTLALMVPASWGENKETYQLPDSLEGKTVILHTNDVHCGIDQAKNDAGEVTNIGYAGVAAYKTAMATSARALPTSASARAQPPWT